MLLFLRFLKKWGIYFFPIIGLSYILYSFLLDQTDTSSYVDAIYCLLGETGKVDRLQRLSKPVSLLVPTLLYTLFFFPIKFGMLLQQFFAYLACLYFFYAIVYRFSDERQATLAMIMLCLCQPMAIYGLAMMIDALGWFWALSGIYWSIQLGDKKDAKPINFFVLGGYIGLGMFVKESAIVSGIFAFIFFLRRKDVFSVFLFLGIGFFGVFFLGIFFTTKMYGVSLVSWFNANHGDTDLYASPLHAFVTQSIRTLDNFWVLVVWGLAAIISTWKKEEKIHLDALKYILLGIVLLLIMPFVWPYTTDRILFLLAPSFIFAASYSIYYFKYIHLVFLIVSGGLAQLLVTFFIYKYQIPGLLLPMYGVYIICSFSVYIYNRKNNFLDSAIREKIV